MNDANYNERLFSGGVRKWIHEARFFWLSRKCQEFNLVQETVLELGCFDARSISYLPNPPLRYSGYDANWEGGLDSAKDIFSSYRNYVFNIATKPEHIVVSEKFDLCISLETLEHIPPELINDYLKRLSEVLKDNGSLLISVPNEKGAIFLAKYIVKRLFLGGPESYSLLEVLNATMGRMSRVNRNEHKGFDWEQLREQLLEFFVIIQIQGIQFSWLPIWANAQVGFVLKPKIK